MENRPGREQIRGMERIAVATPPEWQAQLEQRMRRFQRALDQASAEHRDSVAQLQRTLGERRTARQHWREQRRERWRRGSLPGALTYFAVALWASLSAFNRPYTRGWMWWLALGMGIAGVSQLVRYLRARRALPAPQPAAPALPAPARDPRLDQVDALCARLEAELEGAPGVLSALGQDPGKTAQALRTACHELVRREQGLRAQIAAGDDARLAAEREGLEARIAAEADPVAKERFTGALAALDEQRRQRAELGVAASRLEAEHARLYYTLQNLHAQVLRVKSADTASADVAGAGLRYSVEQLGAEIEAVASALEDTHRAPATAQRTGER